MNKNFILNRLIGIYYHILLTPAFAEHRFQKAKDIIELLSKRFDSLSSLQLLKRLDASKFENLLKNEPEVIEKPNFSAFYNPLAINKEPLLSKNQKKIAQLKELLSRMRKKKISDRKEKNT